MNDTMSSNWTFQVVIIGPVRKGYLLSNLNEVRGTRESRFWQSWCQRAGGEQSFRLFYFKYNI